MHHFHLIRLVCLFTCFGKFVGADDYVDEVQGTCYKSKKLYNCAKYRLFKYIDDYKITRYNLTSDSSVQFVNFPDKNVSDPGIFTRARQSSDDSELTKIFKFFQRQVDKFFNTQGLSVELPEGTEVVDEDGKNFVGDAKSRRRKRKMMLIPLLILVKVFKIKIMVSLILVGVVLIKKMLVVGAFLLPGIVASIKAHCKAQYHVVPYHVDDDHYHHDHDHDHEDIDPGYGLTGYDAGDKYHHHWDRSRKRYSHH